VGCASAATAHLKRPVNVGDLSRSESVLPVIVRGDRRSARLIQRLLAASATASRVTNNESHSNSRFRRHRDLCRHRRPTAARPMRCRRSRKRGDRRFLFPLKFHHHRFWARTVPGCASPAGGPHDPAAFQPLSCRCRRAREAWGAPCAADATSGSVAVSVSA